MKKLLLFVFAAFAFAACEQAPIEEQSAVRQDAPETITVGFEGDETRIQLNEAQKTVWTKGDQVSVFYFSDANQLWQYNGETGSRTANLKRVNTGEPTAQTTYNVVAYPFNEDYFLNTRTGALHATLPATQHYLKDSYGVGDNLMVAQSEFTQFSLKSVCGWLKLQLTGNGETIKSITFRGNNGEQVAGLIHVDTATAKATLASEMGSADDNNTGGNLVFDDTILTEITLDCGEGVALGKNATTFYIALPPQTFENGFKVEVVCADDTKMVKSSSKALSIERNHIQPMAEFSYTANISPSNQIWYTSSDGNVVEPNNTKVFGANIISNTYNNGKGVIAFGGDVTTIGYEAFRNCDSLTSVNIPDSVKTIGEEAFAYCDSLTSVNIPDSVTTIEWGAFRNCDSLTSVTIGDSVTTIGNSTFYKCTSLKSVTIPDSVTEIGSSAFLYCTSLTSITIPDSVTTIGAGAFSSCCLTSVNIPDSVTEIGNYAFYECTSLTSVYCKATTPPALDGTYVFDSNGSGRKIYVPAGSVEAYKSATNWSQHASAIVGYDFEKGEIVEVQPNNEIWYTSSDGDVVTPYYTNVFGANVKSNTYNNGKGVIIFNGDVTSIGDKAFYNCDSLTSVNIPDGVTEIGEGAFRDCGSLTSVNIPDSVTTIGRSTFLHCPSLTSVNIPDGVTTIGYSAFWGCTSLTSVNIPDGVTTIEENAFYACGLTSVTIPDSVTEIGEEAFCFCDSLTSVNIPDSVTTIGKAAFCGCDSLASVTIPDGVTEIGEAVFKLCDSLTSVNIPDSVTTIGRSAFYGCPSLTSVNIPDSVTEIGGYAFYECTSLTSVYCKATTPPSLGGTTVFDYNGSGRKIYVPMESVDAYKGAQYWSEYSADIVGYDFENGVVVE